MKKNKIFKKVLKFKFEEKIYQMFINLNGRIAFLEYISENKYRYPEYDFFEKITRIMTTQNESISLFLGDKIKKYKFIPGIKINGKAVAITSLILITLLSGCSNVTPDLKEQYAYDIDVDIDYTEENYNVDNNSETNLDGIHPETDTYQNKDFFVMKEDGYVTLFNNNYYDELFGENNVKVKELHDIVDNSKTIPKEFKPFVKDFIIRIKEEYPDIDFRLFKYNLERLTIEDADVEDIELESSGMAYYDHNRNVLVIDADILTDKKDNIPEELKARVKIIFAHELGHLFNNALIEIDDYTVKIVFNAPSYGKNIKEAMDVIFTSQPYLTEPGVSELGSLGYAPTTNMMRIILDGLPNYKIEESTTNNIYYLENCISETYGEEIDANRLLTIIDWQFEEYSSDIINISNEDYIYMYQCISHIYLSNMKQDLTYDEVMFEKELLIDKLLVGLKSEEYVYVDVIDEAFENYIVENEIQRNSLGK